MITKKEIEMLAKLSKLKLTEEEKELLVKEMSDIVAFADTINANLSAAEEGYDGESEVIVNFEELREDEEKSSYGSEEVLQNADCENGYFLVRRNSRK